MRKTVKINPEIGIFWDLSLSKPDSHAGYLDILHKK